MADATLGADDAIGAVEPELDEMADAGLGAEDAVRFVEAVLDALDADETVEAAHGAS